MIDFKNEIIELLESEELLEYLNVNKKTIKPLLKLEIPKDHKLGDYAFPCFELSKLLKKNPNLISEEITNLLLNLIKTNYKKNLNIDMIQNIGPYVNFFIRKEIKSKKIIESILDNSCFEFKKRNENVMVEYCQVNTHKAFHVGHLRGTLIGSSLVNLYKNCGFNVISANYQGDSGAHVAKSLWFLKTMNKEKMPDKRKGIWLGNIYQKVNELLKNENDNIKKEKYKEEISRILQKLEARDKELFDLWKKTRQYSLDDFEEIYNLLGIKFDRYFFESEMEEKGREIVKELLKKNIAYYDDKAVIIDLKKYDLGIFIILKRDGTTLYSTKDLALAKIKFDQFKVDKSIYVVGSEQKYYFQQLFKTLELMNFENAKYCKHIPFDLVTLEGGKISSREGELILAIDLIEEITQSAIIEIKKRGNIKNIEDIEETAKNIAISALKFGFLSYDNNKTIIFNMNKALDFEGETGPYIQYVYARICSILKKSDINIENIKKENINYSLLLNDFETKIISKLIQYNFILEDCINNNKIHTLAKYLIELSQLFNEFYHNCPILKVENDLKYSRLALIISVKKIIANGLKILGIKTLEKM
jgi:arginyl-tRNA synthetase